MRSTLVIIPPPFLQLFPCLRKGKKQLRVQTFIAQLPLEALDEPIVHRPTWPDEVEPYSVLIRPRVQHPAAKLTPMVHRDALRLAMQPRQACQTIDHSF